MHAEQLWNCGFTLPIFIISTESKAGSMAEQWYRQWPQRGATLHDAHVPSPRVERSSSNDIASHSRSSDSLCHELGDELGDGVRNDETDDRLKYRSKRNELCADKVPSACDSPSIPVSVHHGLLGLVQLSQPECHPIKSYETVTWRMTTGCYMHTVVVSDSTGRAQGCGPRGGGSVDRALSAALSADTV